MHYPKEDDGEHYTACLLIKGLRGIEPRILYPKEESGSHCLLILDLKPHSAGLKNGSTIMFSPETLEEHQAIWDRAVAENIFVICKTPMAKSITRRTLLGFRGGKTNMWAPDDLINKIKNQPELFIKKVRALVGKNVKIKAIVGNPPYQDMGGSGGTNDAPINQEFCMIASRIKPNFVSLVIPSRWFAAGRENLLGEFRSKMLKSGNISKLTAYNNSRDLFSNVEIKGGVCYFLEDLEYSGDCDYTLVNGNTIQSDSISLDSFDVLIREPKLAKIVSKVSAKLTTWKRRVCLTPSGTGDLTPSGIIRLTP